LRANFSDRLLLRGASRPGVIPPGGRGEIILEWEKFASTEDYNLQLTLTGAGGQAGPPLHIVPYAGEYPTSRWDISRRLHMPIRFAAPDQAGQYVLRLGWVDPYNRWVPARCGWMQAVSDDCAVATFTVAGTRREAGINFADQVVLVDSQVSADSLRPGETLNVTLRWQGLGAWPADYTAFVHLVGPDGKVHGQVDAYPVQGTLPTTQWQAGQIVNDPYAATLAPDAPPGDYQVEVGWYLLATLRRLSVLDAAGRPIDNRVIVGTVQVVP
jgi:hypothetical protein